MNLSNELGVKSIIQHSVPLEHTWMQKTDLWFFLIESTEADSFYL